MKLIASLLLFSQLAWTADLSDLQSAQNVKLSGADSAGVESYFIGAESDGSLKTTHPSVLSTANSTSTPLGANATFTGTFEEVLPYSTISIIVVANQASAASGLVVQWSSDGTNIDDTDSFSVLASSGKQYSFGAMARYFRIVYTNGTSAQSSFRLQTIFHRVGIKNSSHRLDGMVVGDDDAELVKAAITGKATDGNYYNVQVDTNGRLVTSAITGFGSDFSFGDVTTAATTRAAVRRTTYTEQTSNAQRSINSSSANDTSAGTGARTVLLTYMDSTGAGPFTETVTLNGTTNVNTVATNICFIESMEVVTVGSTGSNVGTLTLHAAAAGGGATIGTIAATDNQTFWAHHYVPTGKIANITGLSFSHNGTTVGSGAAFTINSIAIPSANMVEKQVSDTPRLYGQSSTTTRTYVSPLKVTGPARVTIYVTPETASSTVYRASLDFFEP